MGTSPNLRARGVIPAVFFLSAAALADEIVLIRLLSVRFWPHFVPLIVSQAMLGFGAAGVALHLLRSRIGKSPRRVLAGLVIAAAPSFDLAFRASQRVPFDPFLLMWEASSWPVFCLFFLLLAVPFLLAGGAIAVPFSFGLGRPGPVYAASFAGSAFGALAAVPGFHLLPTESLLRLPLGLGIAASAFLITGERGRPGRLRTVLFAASVGLLLLPPPETRLSPYKDLAQAGRLPGARTIAARSGPSGDCRAVSAPGIHSAPGLSIRFEGDIPPQSIVFCDGEARGVVPVLGGKGPPAYLDFFPGALPYGLVDRPAVLQLALRGTEGVLTAARNGASSITVIESSPELADLVAFDLSGTAGGWPRSPPPEIRREGARNFLAREGRRYDLIEVADISSATFSSLGIHATGETYLLTREGVRAAMSRLTGTGVLAYTGWLKSPPRESVKILETLKAEMERAGGPPPAGRILMVRGWGTFCVLARRLPFSASEIGRAGRFCGEKGFAMVWPGPDPAADGGGIDEKALREAVRGVLAGPRGDRPAGLFDLRPVTDDSPYFHRFLRLRSLPGFRRLLGAQWVPFLEWGVVFLILSLAVSIALAAVCLLLPPAVARNHGIEGAWPLAAYFAALGLAYMLIELTYLKVGILILGDAIRASTAAIGGFSFFSGVGSALAGRFESARRMRGRVFPGIAVLAAGGFLVLSRSTDALIGQGDALRTVAFVGATAPAALLMGMPFPAALARLSRAGSRAIPFAWGVNGFFSVAGASLASVGALWAGFRATVAAGALLYLAAGVLFSRIGGTDPERRPRDEKGWDFPPPNLSSISRATPTVER